MHANSFIPRGTWVTQCSTEQYKERNDTERREGQQGVFCYCVIGKMCVLLSVILTTCLVLAVIGQVTVTVMAKLS